MIPSLVLVGRVDAGGVLASPGGRAVAGDALASPGGRAVAWDALASPGGRANARGRVVLTWEGESWRRASFPRRES